MTNYPHFLLILISKFHSSIQLYGYHSLDVSIAFPIINTEAYLSGSPDFMEETSKKKIKKRVSCTKGKDKEKTKLYGSNKTEDQRTSFWQTMWSNYNNYS